LAHSEGTKKRPGREDSFFRTAWSVDFVFELYNSESEENKENSAELSWLVESGQRGRSWPALYCPIRIEQVLTTLMETLNDAM
jgi:hypothetical protein